jgi:glycosyltransferase involved in cell wall biosynthesis
VHQLAGRGIKQRVFTVGPAGPVAPDIGRLGIEVTSFHKSTKAGLGAIVGMARTLRHIRPDLVQAHGEAGALWGVAAATLARMPSISLMYLDTPETPLKMRAFRLALRSCASVIASSGSVATFVKDALGVPPGRTAAIPCGIDPGAFPARTSVAIKGQPVVIAVGRLVKVKGHRVLIDAFRRVLGKYPGARLDIVGDGVERRALEAQAADLRGSVRLLGTRYPTTPLLQDADVFVLPSLAEAQGLAILEAFATNLPVVASRTGGIVEMVEDGVDGLLAEPGDAVGLASAILRVLGDDTLRERLVMHARTRLPHYDIRRLTDEYVGLYEQVIARKGTRD